MSSEPVVLCSGITKRFGRHVAVDGVDLQILRGEVCALMGPNGAGKSTLLRILAGLMRADGGVASVMGHDPRASSSEFRKLIGVVPEKLALLPELTLEEQLAASGPVYGLDRRTTRSRSHELLEALDLFPVRRTFAREGSHGMRKKTAIALALLHNPAVLMMDEPFEGLDPASADVVAELFLALGRRGTTVLFSSHAIPVVDRIANRLVVMRGGSVSQDVVASELAGGAHALYFDSVALPVAREMAWLGSPRS